MASVYKRPSDKARGKLGKWTISYKDASGRRRAKVGTTNRLESQQMATRLEDEATLVREGIVGPATLLQRRHAVAPLDDHLTAYGEYLAAKGDSALYCRRVLPSLARLLGLAGVDSIGLINAPAIQQALGRMRSAGRSARTCNFHLSLGKAFIGWLVDSGRLSSAPLGMKALKRYNEKADRRRVRRALTPAEVGKLLAAVEASPPRKTSRRGYQYSERWMTGPQRAALYRLALGTGFRADELRSLRAGSFRLDGPEPAIELAAADEKAGRGAVQPITLDLATQLRPYVGGKAPDEVVLEVPMDMADLLRRDLQIAEIPFEMPEGVADFHSLRGTFITHLVNAGVGVKVVQALARHSTVALTLDRYAHLKADQLRDALDTLVLYKPSLRHDARTEE